jgi:hypothetical protein
VSARAHLDVVERVMAESGVDRTPAPEGWIGYVRGLAESFAEWMVRAFPRLSGVRALADHAGTLCLVLLGLLLLGVVYAWLRGAARRRRPSPPAPPAAAAPPPPEARDRAAWRAEIDRRLGRGDVPGALEALWWWFARSVSAAEVDPSWTSRELLARSGRADLAPLARGLDRLLYGSARPTAADVRLFLGGLERALA